MKMTNEMYEYFLKLYNQAFKLDDTIFMLPSVVEYVVNRVPRKQLKGKNGAIAPYNIYIANELNVCEKRSVIFHESLHAWLMTFEPNKHNEENVLILEEAFYGRLNGEKVNSKVQK